MDWENCPGVESVPGKVSGNWVFTGTRLPLYVLFDNLAGGANIYDFVEWFDGADESEARAVLEYIAKDLRERAAQTVA